MAEKSRSPRREKHLWVKVKGGVRPTKISITELHDVDDLLKAVKAEVHPELDSRGVNTLQLFQSEEAKDGGSEALRADLRVAEIAGGEDMKKPLYVSFPDAEVATASQASEWYNVTGVLSGWGRQFGARRGLFHNAAQAEARGAPDKCIVHMGDGNIQLNLWFQSEGQLQKFDAALAVSAEVFGNHTMKLERKKASPPTPHPASVFASDYNRNPDSPEQRAKSDSGAGATVASGMRKRLENQRVAVTSEMTYKNMRIIPVALLQDNRKLTKNPKWDKNGNKVKQSGNNDPKVGQEWKQSGNKVGTKNPKVGQEREQSGNQKSKVGQEWEQEPQSGARMETKWEQSGNENCKVGQIWKVGQEWEPSGNKNPKLKKEWAQSKNKVGTRTPKWDKNGNKVGTKWEQEPQSGTRMETKSEQSVRKNPKVGQEWKQSGNKVGTRTPKWDK
ncbi:ATP-dependent Clp protease ATP-binding subunit clpA-like [Durusdinium trenchii]|uniref:ATP-dependent Clp protease ATP-binding subunit clpA-like n=1 Tax=Durusdinium trenchii TaxID=1381693 RepID=A0ABP0L013_9DINO